MAENEKKVKTRISLRHDLKNNWDNVPTFIPNVAEPIFYENKNRMKIGDGVTELSKLKKFLIKRFLLETDIHYKVCVDAFIHGTPNDFLWVSSNEVITFLENSDVNSNSLHVSNLYIQSWNKNLIRNNRYEHCREYIQVKWFSMYNDIIKIMSNRNLYM